MQELEKALRECQQRLQAAEKDLQGAQERKAQLQASAGTVRAGMCLSVLASGLLSSRHDAGSWPSAVFIWHALAWCWLMTHDARRRLENVPRLRDALS